MPPNTVTTTYTFGVSSDDASSLYIDNVEIANNSGAPPELLGSTRSRSRSQTSPLDVVRRPVRCPRRADDSQVRSVRSAARLCIPAVPVGADLHASCMPAVCPGYVAGSHARALASLLPVIRDTCRVQCSSLPATQRADGDSVLDTSHVGADYEAPRLLTLCCLRTYVC